MVDDDDIFQTCLTLHNLQLNDIEYLIEDRPSC